ncbi:hypothetical protein QR705_25180, partial [Escherichia coli]|uniref:hypothetical protein n=1 Tax=Escherichia coli TaxID=562 RepID=UPI00256EFCA2
FIWEPLLGGARGLLDALALSGPMYKLFASLDVPQLHAAVAPLVVVIALVPLIVATVMALIAVLSVPVVIRR